MTRKHIIPPKFRKYLFAIFFILIATGIILLYSVLTKPEPYVAPTPSVIIKQPENGTISESITLNSYIQAQDMIPVVPFVSGTIEAYPISVGQKINKGQLIAIIDESSFIQQQKQAKAAYEGYASSFLRVESLYNAGAATKQEYDTLKAQTDAAKAQLDLAELQLSYTRVTAPVSGTILKSPQAVGSIASTQQPLAIISNLENQVVRLNVPEKYYELFINNKLSLSALVYKPGEKESAKKASLLSISPYVQPESKMFITEFLISDSMNTNLNNETVFTPGMFVKVQVTINEYENVYLMSNSIRRVDGSVYIYDDKTETVHWLPMTPIAENDDFFIVPEQYTSSWFVIDGQGFAFDGQKVTAQEVK